jgi:hypothetical protein
MKQSSNSYIPALGYRWLTRFYDPVVRVTTGRLHSRKDCSGKRAFKMGTESST